MDCSDDSQAILLLCSHLGLPADADFKPLTLSEWNDLAGGIEHSALQRPGKLLDTPGDKLTTELRLSPAETERITVLLDRRGTLAIELERLQSLGVWAMTRLDESYPARLRERLGDSAPVVLFGAGKIGLLGQPGLAVVGSRDVDEAGQEAAKEVGRACAQSGLIVYSGGARGVDGLAMTAALEAGGRAVGVLADSLEKTIRSPDIRNWLEQGQLTLFSPYSPKAGFSVGAAMGRNKLIYALADYGLVVASDAEQGGTWAGATEALRHKWVPVFVRDAPSPEGNRRLIKKGAIPFPATLPDSSRVVDWLAEHVKTPTQGELF